MSSIIWICLKCGECSSSLVDDICKRCGWKRPQAMQEIKSCKHHFESCNCMVMYCTDSICRFCGLRHQGETHPHVKALLEQIND